ncbi:hypothetical protein PybrP1_006319 [[Pythium] brassicae (nom. inval.)]|nr:hypothetical protein PybrP1_006319 [[Pythium] brassicae (nom. inval.)]
MCCVTQGPEGAGAAQEPQPGVGELARSLGASSIDDVYPFCQGLYRCYAWHTLTALPEECVVDGPARVVHEASAECVELVEQLLSRLATASTESLRNVELHSGPLEHGSASNLPRVVTMSESDVTRCGGELERDRAHTILATSADPPRRVPSLHHHSRPLSGFRRHCRRHTEGDVASESDEQSRLGKMGSFEDVTIPCFAIKALHFWTRYYLRRNSAANFGCDANIEVETLHRDLLMRFESLQKHVGTIRWRRKFQRFQAATGASRADVLGESVEAAEPATRVVKVHLRRCSLRLFLIDTRGALLG